MDFAKLLAAVPDIGDKESREMAIARLAHASGAADERAKWRERTRNEQDARDMFLDRLGAMQINGGMWVTIAAVFALLNDCRMQAQNAACVSGNDGAQ